MLFQTRLGIRFASPLFVPFVTVCVNNTRGIPRSLGRSKYHNITNYEDRSVCVGEGGKLNIYAKAIRYSEAIRYGA